MQENLFQNIVEEGGMAMIKTYAVHIHLQPAIDSFEVLCDFSESNEIHSDATASEETLKSELERAMKNDKEHYGTRESKE